MTFNRSNFMLFGTDLSQIYDHWRRGWSEALQWPFLARLFPVERITVRYPDGHQSIWPMIKGEMQAVAPGATLAVLLPEDIVLRQRIVLPRLSDREQLRAVELAVQAASPFPAEQIVWGFHEQALQEGVQIELALANRAHVMQYVESSLEDNKKGDGESGIELINSARSIDAIEVWADTTPPIILSGFGEQKRRKRARWAHMRMFILLMLLILLIISLAASFVLNKRQQAFDAQDRLIELTREVTPIVAERDALNKANEQLQNVHDYVKRHPDPREILGRVSMLLPDTVYLFRFSVSGRTVTMSGLAENAAELMDALGAQPDFAEVKAPGAISRDSRTGRESFSVEFQWLGQERIQ